MNLTMVMISGYELNIGYVERMALQEIMPNGA